MVMKIPWSTKLAPLNEHSDYEPQQLKLTFNELNQQAKLKNLEHLRRSQINHTQLSTGQSANKYIFNSIRKSSVPSIPQQENETPQVIKRKVPRKVI